MDASVASSLRDSDKRFYLDDGGDMEIGKAREIYQRVLTKFLKFFSCIDPFIAARYAPYRVPGGRIFLNIKESPMMILRVLGLYEIAKFRALRMLLHPGDFFVDVGANKGDFTLLAASIVGNSGKVLSFEPEPSNYHWTKESIKLNNYTNISLYDIALSDCDGNAKLYLGRKSGFHTLLPGKLFRNEGVIDVKTRTLDSLLREISEKRIDVVKIDVEGADLQVLKGAFNTLMMNNDIILLIDIHPLLGVNPKEVYNFLNQLNFTICKIRFPFARLTRIAKWQTQILACREGVLLKKVGHVR